MIDGLSPNMEHYLQTIYLLQRKHKVARVKEIADFMGVTMPSVTSAVKSLKDKQLVDNTRYGYVELTDAGADVAIQLIERHKLLHQFLLDVLKLDETIAQDDACQIEHVISDEAMSRLSRFIKLVNRCPRLVENWNELINSDPDEIEMMGNMCENCPDEAAHMTH